MIKDLYSGLRYLIIGFSLIRQRGIRRFVAVPLAVNVLVFGTLLPTAREIAQQLDASLYNMRFIKPLDASAIRQAADSHDLLVTIEENAIAGGAGSAVNEWLTANGYRTNILNLGFPDTYVGQGTQPEMLSEWGLDADGILKSIEHRLAGTKASNCQ